MQKYGWMQVSHDKWRGRFRNARAHRLPPEVPWRQVMTRTTVDANTREVLEESADMSGLMTIRDATRKLDRVRDIECIVSIEYDDDELKNVAAGNRDWRQARRAVGDCQGVRAGGRSTPAEDRGATGGAIGWDHIPRGQRWADVE